MAANEERLEAIVREMLRRGRDPIEKMPEHVSHRRRFLIRRMIGEWKRERLADSLEND